MANILGTQTIDSVNVISTDTDPSTGSGTVSPLGSICLTADGLGTFTKTGANDTEWNRNLNTPLFGVARYVYLVQDAADASKLGGSLNSVYSTFQDAYDAANTLQVLLGGSSTVVIQVGNTTSATVGNLTLTANWNNNIHVVGLSLNASRIGTITSTTFTVNAIFNNITVGTITTEGNVTLTIRNSTVGNITTTSATGASGNVTISGSFNSVIGTITQNAILGNCGSLTYSNCGSVTTGTISVNQTSTTTSFNIGALTMTNSAGCRFGAYTATMAYAASTGTVGGFNINNTNQSIIFAGVVIIQAYTNATLATSDAIITNFVVNNTIFNANVHINSRDIASAVSQTGGTIVTVNVNNVNFNGATNRIYYNATTGTLLTATFIVSNCEFNSTTSSGGLGLFIYNVTFTTLTVEDCSVVDTVVGITIDNTTSPIDLIATNPLIVSSINSTRSSVNGKGAVIVNIAQPTLLAFDDVVFKDIHTSILAIEVVDGDVAFRAIGCNCDDFVVANAAATVVKRSKFNDCDGNIDSDGNIFFTINTSNLVFVNSVANQDVIAYTSTLNFYALGAITITGTLYTSNIIRKNTATLITTMNNSFDISLP